MDSAIITAPPAVRPAATPAFKDAVRVQDSVLTTLEKRTLRWLAVRLPRRVHSDHLTLLALVSMLGAGASFWLARVSPIGLALVVVCLALNWFGDSLDGTVARVRQQQRPRYGYYVDHVVDAFGALFLFAGLALSGYMTPWVAGVLLLAYFMLCLEVYLATHSLGRFQMSFFKMGPTELRILLSIGALAVYWRPTATLFGQGLLIFDIGGVVGAAGLFLTLIYSAVRNTRALYRAEPMPEAR